MSEILGVLRQLIRMRGGKGKFDEVARLGPLAMLCFVAMSTARRGIPLAELVQRTGRRKDNLRRKMREMSALGIVRSPREDFYVLPLDFWQRYDRELERSGITEAEQRQKQRHEVDRIKREEDLRKRQQGQREKVVEMHPSMGKRKRRAVSRVSREKPPRGEDGAKLVPIASGHQGSRERKEYRRDDVLTPAEAVMQEEYDRMVGRCMDRLGDVRGRGVAGEANKGGD